MKIIKADNYQTWYIEEDDQAILIDPWLSNKLKPDNSFFIQREKENDISITKEQINKVRAIIITCLLYTSPSPRDATLSRMPSSA